jgi:hypothetical protein
MVKGLKGRRYLDPETGRFTSTTKRTLAEQKRRTSWAGADKTIAKRRPKSILEPPTPVKPKPRAVPKLKLKPPSAEPGSKVQGLVVSKTLQEAVAWASKNKSPRLLMKSTEASKEVARSYSQWANRRVAMDPERWEHLLAGHSAEQAEKNWKKVFRSTKGNKGGKAAFTNLNQERALAVQNAINDNHANPVYRRIKEKNFEEKVLLRRPEVGQGANAEFRVVTHYYDQWPFDEVTSVAGKVLPGKPTVPGGIANVLRHEYGHGIYDELSKVQRSKVSRVFASNRDRIGKDLSSYAATREEEFFAEAFSLATDRHYDPKTFEPWVQEFVQNILTWVGGT